MSSRGEGSWISIRRNPKGDAIAWPLQPAGAGAVAAHGSGRGPLMSRVHEPPSGTPRGWKPWIRYLIGRIVHPARPESAYRPTIAFTSGGRPLRADENARIRSGTERFLADSRR